MEPGLVNLVFYSVVQDRHLVNVAVFLTSILHSYQDLPCMGSSTVISLHSYQDLPSWDPICQWDFLSLFLLSISLLPVSIRKCPAPDTSIKSFILFLFKSKRPNHDF